MRLSTTMHPTSYPNLFIFKEFQSDKSQEKEKMFENWLKTRLKELKIDTSVYLSYIIGILEDSIDEDEKIETLTDIIQGLIESDAEKFVNDLFEKWNESHNGSQPSKSSEKKEDEVNIAEMLKTQAKISQQASNYNSNRQLTEEEKRIKEQILANYSQTEFHEENPDDDSENETVDDPNLEKNTNKIDVQKLAKEKREQAKLESAAKKQKDKEDRAKQKASRDEKKANRKAAAVKGERRR